MKKTFSIVFVFLCIIMAPIAALADWQSLENVRTGEEWNAMEEDGKPAFLRGMLEKGRC